MEAINNETMLSLVTNGDCSRLSPENKLAYYKARCDAAGLDPRTKPFDLIRMNGKEILYPTKECSNQLASNHGIVCEIVSQNTELGIRTVIVRAKAKDGRQTDEIGCVTVEGLKGDALCNALMKCVTKAKRRAILSLCGLGLTDETELETIPLIGDEVAPKVLEQRERFANRYGNGAWRSVVVHVNGNYTGKSLGEIADVGKLPNWSKWTPKKGEDGCLSAQDSDLKEAIDTALKEFKPAQEVDQNQPKPVANFRESTAYQKLTKGFRNFQWRQVEAHFGTARMPIKGMTLEQVEKDSQGTFLWLINKWEPREHEGKLSPIDLALRSALDAAMEDIKDSQTSGIQDDAVPE